MTEAVLRTEELTKRFGGVVAVDDVSVEIQKGKLKALIGPNGAGKTTFFNVISGVLKPTSGKVFYKGEDVTGRRPDELSKKGLVRSFQLTQIFPNLYTIENVRLAAQSRAGKKVNYNLFSNALGYESFVEKAVALLEEFGLQDKKHVPARDLSRADMRKLDVVIALASDPDVLLLDEPTAGMAVEEISEVLDVIESVHEREEDLTILLIEHKVDVVMEVAESIMVLSDGKLIADGEPQEIREDEKVQEAYLGAI